MTQKTMLLLSSSIYDRSDILYKIRKRYKDEYCIKKIIAFATTPRLERIQKFCLRNKLYFLVKIFNYYFFTKKEIKQQINNVDVVVNVEPFLSSVSAYIARKCSSRLCIVFDEDNVNEIAKWKIALYGKNKQFYKNISYHLPQTLDIYTKMSCELHIQRMHPDIVIDYYTK